MNKYAMYIRKVLSARDLAEQLAEECSELAKASLKMIRAGGMSANITPIPDGKPTTILWKNRRTLSRCCGY